MKLTVKTIDGKEITIEKSTDIYSFSSVLNAIDSSLVPFLSDWFSDSKSLKVSTSGSTGTPKIIELSKESMIKSAQQTLAFFNLKPHQTALLCLPTQFIAGKMMVVRAIVGQLTLFCVSPSGNPFEKINFNIDFAACTPFQVSNIMIENPIKINLITTLIIGGGAMDGLLINNINENWVTTNCYSTFGMTETITHIALRKVNGSDREPFFRTLPSVKVSKSTRDTLLISAPYIQAEVIETNDSIDLIDEHSFIWKGRLDFVINSGGIKLFPEQMEEKIAPLLGSLQFYFSKEPHPSLGEVPVLYIESQPFQLPDFNAVLSKYEIPTKVYFDNSFDRTPTNKVVRK
jgi:O-succinylbenzoic acid--CoA ligase